MAIAITLKEYLDMQGVQYDLVQHPHASSAMQAAAAAHIPGDQIAKSVVLGDDDGYVMAVLPATHRVELGALHKKLNRDMGLATEGELAELFSDCELGAIPPVGKAYGMDTILESQMLEQPDVYFEAGDHRELIHVTGEQFRGLVGDCETCKISHHV